ncbi:MAG TPA: TonB family protein [Polyangiaceae bacterium]|nr:TonB family protein [Polyangiaceae bacterium]
MLIGPSSKRRLCAALFAIVIVGSAERALAQGAAAAELLPPRVLETVEPQYPPGQEASGATAVVVLMLDIDDEGHVTRAVVTTSGGAPFDTEALAAAPRLRFAPATRGGRPIRSKIPFQFAFAAAKKEAPQTPPGPDTAAALADRSTELAPEEDDDGDNGGFVDIEVRGQRAPRESTRQVLEPAEIATMPGTNGDALHAVENLPGVARTSGISSNLVVRGSGPQDTGVFADGVWLVNAFHFGGITSVVPTEVLERLDFYPGNFSPEYGRQMGGIIDLGFRSPRKDRLGGLLQFDLLDGRLLAEGPLGPKARFLVAGRRSWVDAWLGSALRSAGAGVTAAPVYYDYQAMIEQDLSSSTTARLLFFGADDRFALDVRSPSAEDPGLGGKVAQAETFLRLQARLDSRLSDRTRFINMVSLGTNGEHFALGNNSADATYNVIDSRSDLRTQLSRAVTAVAGVAFLAGHYDVTLNLPNRPADGEVAGPIFAAPKYALAGSGMLWRPGAFAMLDLAAAPGLKILPGLRVDYSSESGQWTFDPRLTARLDIAPSPRRTTLKGGVGAFHQPPQPFEALAPFGSPSVKNNLAIHYSFGIEQQLSPDVEVSLEGFYKDLRSLVVARSATSSAEGGTDFTNTGQGRTFGSELLVRWKPGGAFSGFVAYTISRSERRLDDTQSFGIFEFDQTHILNALASYRLGRGWSLGGRFRYVTGNPYTPYIGAVADLDAGAYTPIASPLTNSQRVAPFHTLDLRVDKTWTFTSWRLTAYLDVRNAYNRQNPEAMTYNYNYSRGQTLSGLPLLPILGVRGEL